MSKLMHLDEYVGSGNDTTECYKTSDASSVTINDTDYIPLSDAEGNKKKTLFSTLFPLRFRNNDGTAQYSLDGGTSWKNFRNPVGTAKSDQVLTGYTFDNSVSDNLSGTMPDKSTTIETAITSTSDKTKSIYRYNNGDYDVIPGIGYYGSWNWSTEKIVVPGQPAYDAGASAVTLKTGAESNTAITTVSGEYANLLDGYAVYASNGKGITGTMTNRGAVSSTLKCGGSYTIPKGYHNGSGTVTAATLASQTSATAVAANIASGKTAWVDGEKITGTSTLTGALAFGTVVKSIVSGSSTSGSLTVTAPDYDGKAIIVILSESTTVPGAIGAPFSTDGSGDLVQLKSDGINSALWRTKVATITAGKEVTIKFACSSATNYTRGIYAFIITAH